MFILKQFFTGTLTVALILYSSSLHESRASVWHADSPSLIQVDERETGIQLYEKGNTTEAVNALQSYVKKQKSDTRAWHFLGLALNRLGKTKDARKAHEKAAKIGVQLIADRVGAVSPQEIYSVVKLIKSELEGAAESADKYLALSSNPSKSTVREWRDRAELLRTFGELSNELNDNHIFGPKDVTTKARILSKPVPEYTEEARKNQATGTVILLLILTSDGKVKGFLPIATLPYGLTEMSIEAARRIRFSPATIDGKPVSQFIKVEYNFNIY